MPDAPPTGPRERSRSGVRRNVPKGAPFSGISPVAELCSAIFAPKREQASAFIRGAHTRAASRCRR